MTNPKPDVLLELADRCEIAMLQCVEEAMRHTPGPSRSANRTAAAEWATVATTLRSRAKGQDDAGR